MADENADKKEQQPPAPTHGDTQEMDLRGESLRRWQMARHDLLPGTDEDEEEPPPPPPAFRRFGR